MTLIATPCRDSCRDNPIILFDIATPFDNIPTMKSKFKSIKAEWHLENNLISLSFKEKFEQVMWISMEQAKDLLEQLKKQTGEVK
jgi:hypothetical protein